MLVDVAKIAKDKWDRFTAGDLEVLNMVAMEATRKAAEIAKKHSVTAANEILEAGLHP